jgi:hypothetical protein
MYFSFAMEATEFSCLILFLLCKRGLLGGANLFISEP